MRWIRGPRIPASPSQPRAATVSQRFLLRLSDARRKHARGTARLRSRIGQCLGYRACQRLEELAMSVKIGWEGRYFEDFEVGDVYKHPYGRTVTETDNAWF